MISLIRFYLNFPRAWLATTERMKMDNEMALAALRANNAKIDAMINQVAKVSGEIRRLLADVEAGNAISPELLTELREQNNKLERLGTAVAEADGLNTDAPADPPAPPPAPAV